MTEMIKTPGVFDEETGRYICGDKIRKGLICRGVPIAPNWKCQRHGGQWGSSNPVTVSGNLYSRRIWTKYGEIYKEIALNPEDLEALYTTNLTDELAIARTLLIRILSVKEPDSRDSKLAIEGLKIVQRIAKTATEIHEKESNIIKREFMDAIIEAIIQAFTHSNALLKPSDRSRAFMREFASMLPGNTINLPVDDTVEAEVVAR